MDRDLAIGPRPEAVSASLQFQADAFEIIELAVDDDLDQSVFAGDGLVAGPDVLT